MPKASKKTQATHTMREVVTRELFDELAENLAHAMANVIEHPDCCEYLRQRIAELHSGLMTEFQADVADDIRLRFALGAMKASENERPAD